MNKALFLDRDGVINVEKGYVNKIEDFEFIDGIFEVLGYFQESGYLLIIITNQAGIARGYYTEEDFHILNNWMLKQFEYKEIHIKKVYFSPYHPKYGIDRYRKQTLCRKPNPGMIIEAQKEFNLDLFQCILVGDKESDIEAGINAGIGTNILIKNIHNAELSNSKANLIINNINDLLGLDNHFRL